MCPECKAPIQNSSKESFERHYQKSHQDILNAKVPGDPRQDYLNDIWKSITKRSVVSKFPLHDAVPMFVLEVQMLYPRTVVSLYSSTAESCSLRYDLCYLVCSGAKSIDRTEPVTNQNASPTQGHRGRGSSTQDVPQMKGQDSPVKPATPATPGSPVTSLKREGSPSCSPPPPSKTRNTPSAPALAVAAAPAPGSVSLSSATVRPAADISSDTFDRGPSARGTLWTPDHASPAPARSNYDRSNAAFQANVRENKRRMRANRQGGEEDLRLVKPPETTPISQDQLVAEVKGIYAGLVMVESKCIEVCRYANFACFKEAPLPPKVDHLHYILLFMSPQPLLT